MKKQPEEFLAAALLIILAVGGCERQPVSGNASRAIRMLQTPAAEGSMAPNLVAGQDGTIVLSWIEPDGEGHSLRHSRLDVDTWSEPQTVISGDNWFVNWADFPSVVPVSDSRWAAHWLVSQAAGGYAYDVHTAISDDAGRTWSEPIIPHSDNTETEHGFVTIFADDGDVGMVWLDGRKMVNEYDETDVRASGMTLRSANISEKISVSNEAQIDDLTCDCCQTDVALTDDGPVAIYRNRTVDEIRDIYVSRRVDGEWQPGAAVSNDHWDIAACPVNGPVIQAEGSMVAVAWFTAANDAPKVKVAWSDDSGRTFSEPAEVAADHPLGHVGAAFLPNGDLAVGWLRSTGTGGAELLLKKLSRGGNPGRTHVLEEATDVFAFSVPQLTRAGDNLVIAWTTEAGGIYGVESAIVPVSILTSD